MLKVNRLLALITALLIIFGSARSLASTGTDAKTKGTEIAREVNRRDAGFGHTKATLSMILQSATGKTSERRLTVLVEEVEKDGDKTLFRFDSPRSVRNTALLTYSHIHEADQQWIYLPAIKRVKRLASSQKSGAFMGSEFAYEDLTSQEVERYSYRYIAAQQLAGKRVFVLERIPAYADSGYSRQQVYIDAERYIPLQVEYFNKAEQKEKTLTFTDYQQYKNKYWRAGTMTMVNHLTDNQTVFVWQHYDFDVELADSDFLPNKLKIRR